jgi:hypothetical protein
MIRPPWIWSGGLQAPQSNVDVIYNRLDEMRQPLTQL